MNKTETIKTAIITVAKKCTEFNETLKDLDDPYSRITDEMDTDIDGLTVEEIDEVWAETVIPYTEEEITTAVETYEYYHEGTMSETGYTSDVNRVLNESDEVVSFTITLVDQDGYDTTGYDEEYAAR